MTFRAPLIQKARDRDYSAAIGAQVGALALALTSGIAPRPFAQTDWPNPSRAIDRIANRVQPDIRGAIRFAAAPTPFAQTDWPNPTAPRRLREGLTVNDSALVGQDQFFGGPGQPPPSRDWPNPVQRTAVRQDFVGVPFARATAPVAPPFAQSDWSLHRPSQARNLDPGQSSAPALRTIIAAPFAQTDWPVPRGRTFPLDGRTLALRKLPGGDALPFRASDWTMPIAAKRGIELLTWAPGLLLSNQPPPVVLTVAFAKASDSAAFQATASDSAAKAGVSDT